MDFALTIALFAVFGLGVVLVFQSIVGHEIHSEGKIFGRPFDLDRPGVWHPPERHPWRLALIGLVMMAGAIGLGILLL